MFTARYGLLFSPPRRGASSFHTRQTAHPRSLTPHISCLLSCYFKPLFKTARNSTSLQHPYQSFVHSLASLKSNRIRQLKAGIDNREHPVKSVGVGNEMTKANCIAGFGASSVRTRVMICVQHLLKLALLLR